MYDQLIMIIKRDLVNCSLSQEQHSLKERSIIITEVSSWTESSQCLVSSSEYHHPSITIAGPLRSNIGVGEKYHQVNQRLSTFPFLSSKHISYMFLPCHSLIISNESFQVDWQPNSFHIFINFWENSFQAGVRLDF